LDQPEHRDGAQPVERGLTGFIKAAGTILAVSYPILALSTGARAIYQLFFKEGVSDRLPPALSAVAAVSYLWLLSASPTGAGGPGNFLSPSWPSRF
jgi:hypothetical protein